MRTSKITAAKGKVASENKPQSIFRYYREKKLAEYRHAYEVYHAVDKEIASTNDTAQPVTVNLARDIVLAIFG